LAVNVYEGLFIFDSSRYSSDPHGLSGQLGAMVEKHGGQMLASRLWEDRRLAYPIQGKRTGTYWLTYFKLDSQKLTLIERESQLNENILRSLIIKIEARIADAVVAHAQTSVPTQPVQRTATMRPRRDDREEITVPDEELN
jgi:small subunit ribosomal protein S6